MKTPLARIARLTKGYFTLEIVGALFTLGYAFTVILGPLVSKYLVDDVIPSRSTSDLGFGLLVFGGVLLAQPALGIVKDLVFLRLCESMTKELRGSLFHRVLYAPLAFFDRAKRGAIISRTLIDGREAGIFASNFFVVFLKNAAILVMVVAAMVTLSWRITLIVIVCMLVYLAANWFFSARLSDAQQRVQTNYDTMSTSIEQMSTNVSTIKALKLESVTEESYKSVLDRSYRDNLRIGTLEAVLNNFTTVLAVSALCVIYGVGAMEVMADRMTLGTVIALGLYFQQLLQPIFELLNSGMGFRKIVPVLNRIEEYESLPEETLLPGSGGAVFENSVTLENISFQYPDRGPLFEDLNLTFPANKTTCILGPSGCGKSTLAYLILGLYQPSAGVVRFGDWSLGEIGLGRVRQEIGYVSQHIELMNISIRDNLGPAPEQEAEMIERCKALGLHDRIMSLPDGYDTVVTERINLSGGERQRLAILRTLLRRPSILLMDEPTSALDVGNQGAVESLLRELRGRCTIIVFTHHAGLGEAADQVIRLDAPLLSRV